MNKKLLFFLLIIVFLGFSGAVFAETISLPNPLCPAGAVGNNCIDSFPRIVNQITTFISTIIGSLAVLMFMYAGILFATSAGNEAKLGQAKQVLIWAIIGVVVSLAGAGLIAVVTTVIGTTPT